MGQCLDSILSQNLPFQYEIVISDDASSDGTWEVALKYAQQYPKIKVFRCNTDDFQPVNRCQRCGFNQCNAYRHSTGKYFAHIDADDFFCDGTEVLRKQVELLELHPECSCCMADGYTLKEGELFYDAKKTYFHGFETGHILSSKHYVESFFCIDHCFVYRRYSHEDPTDLFGGYYDDALITDYHAQFGDIVCLDEAGYVYVQHDTSIWNEVIERDEQVVLGCHSLYIPILIPYWKKTMYRSELCFCGLSSVVEWMLSGKTMSEGNLTYLKGLSGHAKIIELINKKLSFIERLYLNALRWNAKILKHISFEPFHWTFTYLMRPV